MKTVLFTTCTQKYLLTLCEAARFEFARTVEVLAQDGRLVAPYGEKIAGYANLFAIRVTKGQNVRFFYAYDDGTRIYILNGYEKNRRSIPERELRKALAIKMELGL